MDLEQIFTPPLLKYDQPSPLSMTTQWVGDLLRADHVMLTAAFMDTEFLAALRYAQSPEAKMNQDLAMERLVEAFVRVQAIAFGTAVVTVQNGGAKAFATFVIENPNNPLPPQDVTSSIVISQSGFLLNRNTGFYTQTIKLTNSVAFPIPGPLYFVVTDLPTNITVTTAGVGLSKAIAPSESPYIKLQLADGLTLQPGASVSFALQFLDSNRARIAYIPKVVRTLATP